MKRLIKLSLAAATLALMATSANATVLIANPASQPGYSTAPFGPGQSLVVSFGAPNAPGYVLSGTGEVRLTSAPLDPGHAAVPFGDHSGHYMVVQSNESETLDTPMLKSLSLFIGSLDPSNKITFNGADGYTQSFLGSDMFTPATGDQSNDANNRRFYFNFDPSDKIDQIVFTSGVNSFEFDTLAASAVPEPATWAMMLLGFGGIGFLLRASKRREIGVRALA